MNRDEILKAFPLGEWLQARGVKLSKGGRRANRCPVKEHSRPDTVSVDEGKGVWHCHSCGTGGTVIDWLALEKGIEPGEAFKELAREIEPEGAATQKGKPSAIEGHDQSVPAGNVDASKPRIVKRYDYTDAGGVLLHQVERTDPKGFRQRRPDGSGGWIYNLEGVMRVLYRLPKLAAASEVVVCEGERDVETLEGLGFTATTNSGGAGRWRTEYSEALRGKTVIICGDNDAPGKAHVQQVAAALHGVAASVKVLSLPHTVKDVTEYVATFNDKTDAAERFAQMAEGAAEYREPQESRQDAALPRQASPTGTASAAVKPLIQFYRPSEIKAYVIPPETYILGKFVMRGDVVCLAGTPGVGKSRAVTWLAVCGAVGGTWFGLEPSRRWRTLIVQGENGLARLKDEYSLHDCAALDEWIRVSDVPPFGICVESQEFVEQLLAAIMEFKPDLIVIDPFNHIVSDEKFKEFRETIRTIQDIVARSGTQAAVLFVHHLKKVGAGQRQPTGQALLDYLAGSYSFGAAMRTVAAMQFASNLPEDKRRVFTICKANNEERPPATAWQREGAGAWWTADGNFDIAAFLHGDTEGRDRKGVTEDHMAELFENGKRRIARKQAMEQLQELAGVRHTAAYEALKTGGGRKFKALQEDRDGLLVWKPEEGGE